MSRHLSLIEVIALAGLACDVACSKGPTAQADPPASAAAGSPPPATPRRGDDVTIRPFHVHFSDDAIADLQRRLDRTRWPDRETVTDATQGIRLTQMQELAGYWRSTYDWRKAEAKLNALPQFVTTIDGVDIHFIHVKSPNPNALPLLMTHGWPGSIFELLKVIGPLTDPTKFGGRAEDSFDVVIPSLPGFGLSGHPTDKGWDSDRIARSWVVLMMRLGYDHYVAQGGDVGAVVTEAMGRLAPRGLLAIQTDLPATVPPEVATALAAGGPAPSGLSADERAAFDALLAFGKMESAYAAMMATKPETIGYSLSDSPVGLAAWMLGHPGFATWTYGRDPKQSPTRDEVLDDITLYWMTDSAASSARVYWANAGHSPVVAAAQKTDEIKVPVAITVFPGEIYRAPESWARRAYRNLSSFHVAAKGGHFAAWQEPQIFAEEMRAAFRPFRK
jgi:pimeloyl-ACP methyl ester carboxylesterase